MDRSRRDLLGLAGASVATLTAGCLDGLGVTGDAADDVTVTPVDVPETPSDATADARLPAGLERVDEPPYEISVPECDASDGAAPPERDPLYRCANMPAEPSLPFTQSTMRGSALADAGLELGGESDAELFAALLTEATDRGRVSDDVIGGPGRLIEQTDFGTHAVLVVETGWGSGSIYPHVERVEATETGVHAFGCHTDPCVWTDDYASRTTAVRFERPDTLETGVVSLTVAADERWNVAADEGVVAIPDDSQS